MDLQTSAPPVVAVVVTCNPGSWLEETLASLRDQDYPNLSVLVVDADSSVDPTPRVASVLPGAYVRRLPVLGGFSRAANEVLDIVEGASHYLFCHDDVAPEPDTIRVLVEEAFRSNAGIVCPKLVYWDRPDRLLAVGQSVDKTGVVADIVDRGELDQEQHDSVRDVFCAPGGCVLVRADLFASLGGYDPDIDLLGEDLNLSWRSQVAGGRVVVAPAVRVRHLESLRRGRRHGWDDPGASDRAFGVEEAHRLRTVLTCYSAFHLLRVLPQALVLTIGQSLVQLLTGRPSAAWSSILAWPRALRDPGRLLGARRRVQRHRRVSDTEVRRLQSPGSAHVRAFVRAALAGEGQSSRTGAHRSIADRLAAGPWRLPAAAWALTLAVIVIGSRGLWGHSLPGVGSIPVTSGGPASWWHLWWSGWRPAGLGRSGPPPTAVALLAMGGTVLLGGVGVLQKLLVLGPLVIGPLGAYRSARPLGSPLAQAAALVAYAAVPLPFNALAGGRWSGLIVYAAAPWVLSCLRRLGDETTCSAATRRVRILALGLLLAPVAAFVPAVVFVVVLIALGLAAGSALSGRGASHVRSLADAAGAGAAAVVLLLPGSFDTFRSRTSTFGVALGGRLNLADLLRFHTGPVGASPVAWGFLVAAGLPLLIGRSWRLVWAVRLWGVALTCWLTAWAASRGWLPVPLPAPEVLLAPAAAALALSVGVGAAAFRLDLPGYRLGWRQLALLTAAIGLAVASLPALAATAGGRWNLPRRGFGGSVSLVAGDAFRVLWVGDPRALPLGSWQLETAVGYATSDDGPPDVTAAWPPRLTGATPRLAANLRLARSRLTTELGHLLAPMAVRYIVVPSATAPAGSGGTPVPVPNDVLSALGQQVDLRALPLDNALTVYENSAWLPARAVLPAGQTPAAASANQSVPGPGISAVLPGHGPDHYRGALPGNSDVFISATADGGWRLSVGGRRAPQRRAFGWAMSFTTPRQGGKASLDFATPVLGRMLLGFQVALWLMAGTLVMADRRRRGQTETEPDVFGDQPEDGPPPAVSPDEVSRRRPRRVTVPDLVDGDEVWS